MLYVERTENINVMPNNPFIGQMDREIELIEKKPIQSASGAETLGEQSLGADFWANMQEVGGGEDTDGKIKHLVNRTYTIRWDETVQQKSNALILVDGGQRFEVLHVIEIGRKKHLEIRVKRYE